MSKENLKDLPPEERIKKLREKEKQKKKELDEALEQIKESEQEISEQRKWIEKVPIPQVATRDTSNLSGEGKLVVNTLRGRKQEESDDEINESGDASETEESSLEQTLEQETGPAKTRVPQQDVQYALPQDSAAQKLRADYGAALTYAPLNELQDKLRDVYNAVDQRGYMTWQEHELVQGTMSALENKANAAEEGTYSLSQAAALAASTTKQLAHKLKKMYHGSSDQHMSYKA